MEKLRIQKNDLVIVISGKDKGKTGKVMNVNSKSGKASVEGLNVYKKNVKPSKKYPQGGIIDINSPLQISKLMVICPACKKATRTGVKNTSQEKRRMCKKCSEVLQ